MGLERCQIVWGRSHMVRKVSDSLRKLSYGLWKMSDCRVNVSVGLGKLVKSLGKV